MNRRHTLLLIILLALAAGGLWVVETKPWTSPVTPVRQKDPLRIFSMLLPRVVTIELEDHEGGQAVSVQRGKNQTWWLAEPEMRQLDTDKMISMVMTLTSLSAERVLTDAVAMESFGLDQPTLTLHIIGQDASQVLDIGAVTPIGGAFYARRREFPEVYLIGAKTLEDLRRLVGWLPTAVPEDKPGLMKG